MTKEKRRDKQQKREGMKKMARASHIHVISFNKQPDRLKERQKGDTKRKKERKAEC